MLFRSENSEMFRVFKPSSTNAAIGRLIASQPGLSVDVFKEVGLLDPSADLSKTATASSGSGSSTHKAEGAGAMGAGAIPSTGSSASGMYVPTPVVPQSAPFVYKPPPAGGAGATAAQNSGATAGMRFYDQETLQRGLEIGRAHV